jgi:site-specific recombinase XerC
MFQSFKPPKSLTKREERDLLRAVRTRGCPRDRAILTVALGTGLRLRELAGLNVRDVCSEGAQIAWKFALDPKLTKCGKGGIAYLTPAVRAELGRFVRWKRRVGEPLEARSPLFLSSLGRRISLRRVQIIFREWQRAAGFETVYPFHSLRHTAITNVYRATKDLYLTQRFARHSSPLTTTVYTHPTDEELYSALRGIRT